ncbi:MAG: tetratricopeptide repeat protein, partial [Bacteroidetes bacterium]|nr:tetratricopeptide repeat protein [Bacteroidota bacterium]
MQKILTSMVFLVLLLFAVTALYVFEVYPLNPGGPLIPKEKPSATQETGSQQILDILGDNGIARTKTYDEYMTRGKLLETKNYPSLAVSEFQAAAKLDPSKIDPLIQIGRMHVLEKDFLKAKVSFEEALKIDPASLTAKAYLGRALLAMRNPDEAKKVFYSVTNPDQTILYYQGIIALYFGDYEKGKNLLKEAVETVGTDEYKTKAQNFLKAFDEFNTYQGGQPVHLKTLLSRSFNQTSEYQMAIPLLFDVIKQKKDYRDAWILLGYAYLNIEKYQDAIDALETAKKTGYSKTRNALLSRPGLFWSKRFCPGRRKPRISQKERFPAF